MTEEEYFRKNYPDSCYGDKPLSPHWDFFQDGVEFGERKSKKQTAEIEKENAELEKENAELKKELKDANKKVVHLACNQNKDLKRKINKAKEIIKNLMEFAEIDCREYEEAYKEAEQFLSEVEK